MLPEFQIQHSPDGGDGGALDTHYQRGCLSTLSKLANQSSSGWDVVVINSGLHDVCYRGSYPEECVTPEDYRTNMQFLLKFWEGQGRGSKPAQIVWVTTTPVPCSVEKNDDVQSYNKIAASLLPSSAHTADTYDYVIKVCGPVPYSSCPISNTSPQRCSPHYTSTGYLDLAKVIAPAVRGAAARAASAASESEAAEEVAPTADSLAFPVSCPSNSTRPPMCPSGNTCMPDKWDNNGFGCCSLEDAVDCKDDWHCCPKGTTCASDCSMFGCDCIPAKIE